MKKMMDYVDTQGFVVTKEHDESSRGGNSAQHTALFQILSYQLEPKQILVCKEEIRYTWSKINKSEPRLHWNEKHWPGQDGHMSRDNILAFICAFKIFGLKKELWSLLFKILKRAGFMWNIKHIGSDKRKSIPVTDFCGFSMWLIAFRFKYNPLNVCLDLTLWGQMRFQTWRTKHKGQDTNGEWESGDHLNLFVLAESARLIHASYILRQAMRWYKRSGMVQFALNDYFKADQNAPLDVLALEVIDKNW